MSFNKPTNLENNTQENIINPENKIKEGVDFVFEQNPELAQIGTKEQYSEYLGNIFPESKIKNIVYHGGNKGIEEFSKEKLGEYTKALSAEKGFFFSTNKDLSTTYISKEEWETIGELKDLMKKYKDDFSKLQDEYDIINSERRALWDKSQSIIKKLLDSIRKLSDNNHKSINEKYEEAIRNSEKAWDKIEVFKKQTPPDRLPEIWNKDFFDKYELKRTINEDKQMYNLLLNIQNPYVVDKEIDNTQKFYSDNIDKAIENGNDSVILKNVIDIGGWVSDFDKRVSKERTLDTMYKGDDIVVFEPEQIHILGSNQDMENFKKFVIKN